MKAIIPVAGVGERLRPFTHTTPKPLLSVAGKPILAHIIDSLLANGIDELIFVVGYMGEKIEEFVKSRYSVSTHFIWQNELLGLGYAIYLGLEPINNDEPFLIILGDTIIEADISKFIGSSNHIIGIHLVDNPKRFGVVELSGKRIIGMEEKPQSPKSNWVIAGLYYFTDPLILRKNLDFLVSNKISKHGEIQLTDALVKMLSDGEKFESIVIDGWHDCGKPETLLETNRKLLDRNGNLSELAGNIIIPPVSVSESADISNSIIGPYVSIGEYARIKRSILRDCIVGDDTVITNCILENSILGNDSAFSGRAYKLNLGNSSRVELEWE
ncbi:NTP transferase domain-containing protein [bacterium]|nr:NTP transferase domain-containing protein [bacterium]